VLACPRATPAALDSHRSRQPPGDVPARRMSAWRGEAFGQRSGAAAAPAKGAARDHRFPAVSEPIVTEDQRHRQVCPPMGRRLNTRVSIPSRHNLSCPGGLSSECQ
jgi:hypothetical protein